MNKAPAPIDGPIGQSLWKQADRVLPGGGIYLTRSARFAGNGVQLGFIAQAEGCRVVDSDGRVYIDFLCANGPNILGYRHPEVEAVAQKQWTQADAASYLPPALVELATKLLDAFPEMGWAVPAKNGSDVIALAIRVARAATGRDKIAVFRMAYHGFIPELVPLGTGVPPKARADVVSVPYNDITALVAAFNNNQFAAVVLNPLDQNPGMDTTDPTPEFCSTIKSLCAEHGTMLIFDDVRSGFRLNPKGSHIPLNLYPDLICLGKALGNGYAISALLGKEELRSAAQSLMFTASHAFGAVALAAATMVLEIYYRDNIFDALWKAGTKLRNGLLEAADQAGHRIKYTGPPTSPTLLFDGDDPQLTTGKRFSLEAARRGVIFHPSLNWFICAAHDDKSIDEALAAARKAFAATPAIYG